MRNMRKFIAGIFFVAMLIAFTNVDALAVAKTSAKPTAKVSAIKLDKISAQIYIGSSLQLKPLVKTTGSINYTTKYSSSNIGVAKVDAKGIVTAVAAGKAKITASVNSVNATMTIAVMDPVVKSIELELPSRVCYGQGDIKAIAKVEMEPETANVPDIVYSTNNNILTIDLDGTIKTMGVGEAEIMATVNNITSKAAITVHPIVKTVDMELPAEVDFDAIIKANVKTIMEPKDAKIPEMIFSSDNADVAMVKPDGTIEMKRIGKTTIKVVVGDKMVEKPITIIPKVVDIEASLKSKFLMVCERQRLNLKVITKPDRMDSNYQISSKNSLFTIDNGGYIVGKRAGNDTITITVGNVSKELPIVIYNESTDTDKDGLTDDQEIHKYLTDPDLVDSDHDGMPDNDWNERREYTYSIKLRENVLKPYNINIMNSNFQDARVIKDYENYASFELILYPYGSAFDHLWGNPDWQKENLNNPELQQYLKPGITTNWDEQMRVDLIKELNQAGIYPDQLNDLELVRKVSKWMVDTTTFIDGKGLDELLIFQDGKATIPDKYRDRFNGSVWEAIDSFNKLTYGKQMFYNKTKGACLSSSTYFATVWKALGIPTRINFQFGFFDEGNQMEQILILNNLKNEGMKAFLKGFFKGNPGSLGDHYYPELYIGHRWVSVDYSNVGANTLKNGPAILMNQFKDNGETGREKHIFQFFEGGTIPGTTIFYQLVDISDMYGQYIGKEVLAKSNLSNMKSKYSNSHTVIPNDAIFRLMQQKIRMDSQGGSCLSADEISKKNMLILLDYATMPVSNEMRTVFQEMVTNDQNYLNVKIVNGKLLVYLRAETAQKLEQYIHQLMEGDFYTEQYIDFDKQ